MICTLATVVLIGCIAAPARVTGATLGAGACADGQCSADGSAGSAALNPGSWDYSGVLSQQRNAGIAFSDLPGFTRSVYERDHALVTPESRVFASAPAGWTNAQTAHIISRGMGGAHFAMYLADLAPNATVGSAHDNTERFVFVTSGIVTSQPNDGSTAGDSLHADDFAYLPAGDGHRLTSVSGAVLLVFEREHALMGSKPVYFTGSTSKQALLPVPGEVFALRKLLPQTRDYDFNVHVMDFAPGEYLNVKEVHYNQHGLLLLQGQGIYRLGDRWYPVQAGDAIWMAPYVPQWYAALGTQWSRYILYKDTTLDPLYT